MIKILIGPNGFGKTTALNAKKDELIANGIDEKSILFLPSELLMLDEMKDTTDKTFAMEYIISEILENKEIKDKKSELSDAIDKAVNNSIKSFNAMLDEVIIFNGKTRDRDVIKCSNPKEYKKLVKINAADIKNKLGSGQRMQFILNMVKNSTKEYIFLDEPEKHSHPSLLNVTAKLIRDLSSVKNVYIATHSPKLLEMLDFDFSDLEIYNDPDFGGAKHLDIISASSTLPAGINLTDLGLKSQTYYNAVQLEKNIKELHLRDFLECLFCKKVYFVEGVNDELLIKKMLVQFNKKFEDYYIFRIFGKEHYFPFIDLFRNMGIEVVLLFDEDNTNINSNNIINNELSCFTHHKFIPNIESEINYTGHKFNTVDYLNYLDTITLSNQYNL